MGALTTVLMPAYKWPTPRSGMSFDKRAMHRDQLRMWLAFTLRHPLTPGPRRQARKELRRQLQRRPGRTAGSA